MESIEALQASYDRWRNEATRVAGRLKDLAQRAAVYHHLYEASGRNHVFPLLAAHGALWSGSHFRFGSRLGSWMSLPMALRPDVRRRRLAGLADFADAFRAINRSVCIDTYTSFHFTAEHGEHPEASRFVAPEMLGALVRLHHARRRGADMSGEEKRDVFEAFFRSEQATMVGPCVVEALAAFDWPLMKTLALRPRIRFAYFPRGERLNFSDFSDTAQRISNGLKAFSVAMRVGLSRVERALVDYGVLPAEFRIDSQRYFESIRTGANAEASAEYSPAAV